MNILEKRLHRHFASAGASRPDRQKGEAEFDRQRQELHIKMGRPEDPITSLSGGNQQKVVLAMAAPIHRF